MPFIYLPATPTTVRQHMSQPINAQEAWDSFIASRFDHEVKDGATDSLEARLSTLDLELNVFQKQLVVAKRRRNFATPGCRLPSELLALIFVSLQTIWEPVQRSQLADNAGPWSQRFDYAWMTVTHVCHWWRRTALHTPDLWTRIACQNLPPSFTATFLSRSKTMPLSLAIHRSGLSPDALGNWLYTPVLRRTRELSITDMSISEFGACIRLLDDDMPVLEELALALPITVRLSADLDARLAESSFPRLQRLTIRGLALNWNWPMFASGLTHLSLQAHTREMMLSAISLEPQLLPVITTMNSLRALDLRDVLPQQSVSSTQYELPRSLASLVSLSSTARLSAGHIPLLERARCTRGMVVVSTEDEPVLTPIVRELFKTWDDDRYPAVELVLTSQHIVMFYANARPRSLWRVRIDGSFERAGRMTSSKHLWLADPNRMGIPGISRWRVYPYLHLLPMSALRVVSVASSVAKHNFPDPNAWIDAFAGATNVRTLIVSYRRTVDLFLALTAKSDLGTEAGFKLFPQLETLVLHDGLVTQKDDIALMDFLHVRESGGAHLQELMVEENLLSATGIWDSARTVTTVTTFKACTMDQALAPA
ncbi:unnamed protein product [Peniophora sp. CBMAI 1063]|nr:unnamed protein product [Peniophora sp. CBMAI 1063]